tara:strand:- start:9697 stop:10716 length:1020 start_codon:yes stop_codon:yes gene_type:complete
MPIDPFGYDNTVGQINNLTQRNQDLASGVQDWNNKIQQEYNSAKDSESLQDDASYTKDLVGNIMGASGLNSAYKNRKATLVNDAKKRLAELTPPADEQPEGAGDFELEDMGGVDLSAPSIQLSGGLDDAGYGGAIHPTAELPPANTTPVQPSADDTDVTHGYENGGTADLNLEDSDEVKGLKATIGVENDDPTLLGTALGKISGGLLGESEAETLGKVGGAVTNGTIGGVDLIDGLDNLAHNKSFFGKDTSGTDEASKTLQMVAGASDVVGLIPGLEWVAGLGNIAGLVGGVAGMFGDHTKNIQHDANVEAIQGQKKSTPSQVSEGGEIASVSQSALAY